MAETSVFSKRLTELREEKGLKRQEVADALEISRASLEYYEKGQRKPDIDVAARIAQYYGVSTDYLVGLSSCRVNEEQDYETKLVCDYTGLSHYALVKILALTKHEDTRNMLESMLLTNVVSEYIDAVNEYQDIRIQEKEAINELLNTDKSNKDEIAKAVLKYRVGLDKVNYQKYLLEKLLDNHIDRICSPEIRDIESLEEKAEDLQLNFDEIEFNYKVTLDDIIKLKGKYIVVKDSQVQSRVATY